MADNTDDEEHSVVKLRPDDGGKRTYEHTLVNNSRRYRHDTCEHKGPYILDRKLACVECGDCGAMLNPIFVLEKLASREAYWNQRQADLTKYLREISEEIRDRQRTKCTHCGNMTAIRFKNQVPRTWVPMPYD